MTARARVSSIVIVGLVLGISCGRASATPVYHLTQLGTLGGSYSGGSLAYGINDSGQVVGDSLATSSGGNPHAFIYSGGTMTDLGALSGPGATTHATGINASGQAVGYSALSSGVFHAFTYQNGTMSDLGTFQPDPFITNFGSFGNAINANSQVVGWAYGHSGNQDAFVESNGILTDLGTFGAARSIAYSINAAGQIAIGTNGPQSRGILYSNGIGTDMGLLPGTTGSTPYGINDSGQVVGGSTRSGTTPIPAFIYANGTLSSLGILGTGDASTAYAINNSAQIVGDSTTRGENDRRAFLYTGGSMLDLNNLLDAPAGGFTLTDARGINNNGWIVGYGVDTDGKQGAFLLTPATTVPEPSAAVLLAIGAVGLLWRQRRLRLRAI